MNSKYLLTIVLLIFSQLKLTAQVFPKYTIADSGVLFQNAPFKSCHASTLVQLDKNQVLYACFGGDHEGAKDVKIWGIIQDLNTNKFGSPILLATGKDSLPCWNPVLFKTKTGILFLDYKVGKNPREWWAERKISKDNGKHWSAAIKLDTPYLGPIKDKPIQLKNGSILYPSSTESKDEKTWKIHLEISDNKGLQWKYIHINCDTFGIIQPTILQYSDHLQMLCRSKQNAIVSTISKDNGLHWQKLEKLNLPNPNSGIDAVTLSNGWQLLVYNPLEAGKNWWEGRSSLKVALSKDGISWKPILTLEQQTKGEYSYPAVIELANHDILISYTFDRKNIKFVRLKKL